MNGTSLKIPLTRTDHYLGDLNAPVVLIEYGDYESFECKEKAMVFEKIFDLYKVDLCFAFRHFPQVKYHPNSAVAAVASEAANLQGHFWEMHEALLKYPDRLTTEHVFEIARHLKIDMKRFLEDIENDYLLEIVKKDLEGGVICGVKATPTIFLNGIRYDITPSFSKLKIIIDKELENRRGAFLGGQ